MTVAVSFTRRAEFEDASVIACFFTCMSSKGPFTVCFPVTFSISAVCVCQSGSSVCIIILENGFVRCWTYFPAVTDPTVEKAQLGLSF